jgi:hypothetical protein
MYVTIVPSTKPTRMGPLAERLQPLVHDARLVERAGTDLACGGACGIQLAAELALCAPELSAGLVSLTASAERCPDPADPS